MLLLPDQVVAVDARSSSLLPLCREPGEGGEEWWPLRERERVPRAGPMALLLLAPLPALSSSELLESSSRCHIYCPLVIPLVDVAKDYFFVEWQGRRAGK